MCVPVCVCASVCVHVAKKRCMEWVVSSDGRGLKPPQPDICETDFRLPPTSQQGRRLRLTTRDLIETISTCLVQEVKARLSGYLWNFLRFRFPSPSHLGSRSRYKLPPSELSSLRSSFLWSWLIIIVFRVSLGSAESICSFWLYLSNKLKKITLHFFSNTFPSDETSFLWNRLLCFKCPQMPTSQKWRYAQVEMDVLQTVAAQKLLSIKQLI